MGESENKSSVWADIAFWAVSLTLIGFLALLAIPRPNFHRDTSPANACINNMRQIDAAVNKWALEKGKTNGAVFTDDDIKPYIKLDEKNNIPKCPSGGKYTYGRVGDRYQVTCSLSTANPPHKLP